MLVLGLQIGSLTFWTGIMRPITPSKINDRSFNTLVDCYTVTYRVGGRYLGLVRQNL